MIKDVPKTKLVNGKEIELTPSELKAERVKAWKEPTTKDINPETGKKYTKAKAEAKSKEMRDDRIKSLKEVYNIATDI